MGVELFMGRKSRDTVLDSLLEKDVFPMSAKCNMPRRSPPGRSCGVRAFRCITAILFNDDLLATRQDERQFATAEIRHLD